MHRCHNVGMRAAEMNFIPEFTVGDRLRKAREASGLGQTEFASELGISRNTVTNYERDHVAARRVVLLAWSMRTGVPLDWIRTGETKNPRPGGPDEGLELPRLDSNQQPPD